MEKWTELPIGMFVPHDCPHGNGDDDGSCIYHDFDDEVCCECLGDTIRALHDELVKLRKEMFKKRKEGEFNEEKAHDKK